MTTISESAFTDSLTDKQQFWKNILKEILNWDEFHPSLLELAKASSLLEFKFGDQIASFPTNSPETNQPHPQDLYLICQGKVRLISWNDSKKRELSIKLLSKNESFGGDSQWSKIIWSYQAIATSPVKILKISLKELNPWLEKRPELDNYWHNETQHRQALIFFKSFTELSSISSRRLQQLLPYLKEREIAAGEKLSSLVAKEPARFWLRSGQITDVSIESGRSWGYLAETPSEWIAQTPLCVYEILKQDWDAVRIIVPILDNSNSSPKSSSSELTSIAPANAQPPIATPPAASLQESQAQLASDLAKKQTFTIDFPKPLKRKKKIMAKLSLH